MTEQQLRAELQEALLDMFAELTNFPISLREVGSESKGAICSPGSKAIFEPYCIAVRQLPGGLERCDADECRRFEAAMCQPEEGPTLCYAGLYNQALPIRVDGEVKAVLLYGEMLVDDPEHMQRSLSRHEQMVARLGLEPAQAAELRRLLLQAKRYTLEELEKKRARLPRIHRWFFNLLNAEDRQRRNMEKISHEIQTRLQAVIAGADNLCLEMPPTHEEQRKMAQAVLASALALDTVVQNLGDYMEEYRFRPEPLLPLLEEARRLYEAEAARRGIAIHIKLQADGAGPVLEISRHHLQYALNNLVHNAVKYSFRSGPGRNRFVLIEGRPGKRFYQLSIQNYGVGILPEEIESGAIFQDGYQGRLTQGEYRTGSGKGLYFAQRTIAQHHGYIKVESTLKSETMEAEGQPHLTRFTIFLPYRQPKEEENA